MGLVKTNLNNVRVENLNQGSLTHSAMPLPTASNIPFHCPVTILPFPFLHPSLHRSCTLYLHLTSSFPVPCIIICSERAWYISPFYTELFLNCSRVLQWNLALHMITSLIQSPCYYSHFFVLAKCSYISL